MAERLSRDEVAKVAHLARLKLSESELDSLTVQLGKVLDYVRVLDNVDTTDVQPMSHAVEMSNVFREDELRPSLPRDAALSNAPKSDGQSFLVPPILGDS